MAETDDQQLVFASEALPPSSSPSAPPWTVLIVDDEPTVHDLTKRVLASLRFNGRPLRFLSAFSGQMAQDIARQEPTIAIILLDVIMETDDAGLRVVQFVRNELKNRLVRIILRTGQPGQFEERRIVEEFEINDYKAKTDLTVNRLHSTLVASLRDYELLTSISQRKTSLEAVLTASRDLTKLRLAGDFSRSLLDMAISLVQPLFPDFAMRALLVERRGTEYAVLTSTEEMALTRDLTTLFDQAWNEQRSIAVNGAYLGYLAGGTADLTRLCYLGGLNHLDWVDQTTLDLLFANLTSAYQDSWEAQNNLNLANRKFRHHQGLVARLNQAIALRSRESVAHVKRVGALARYLGEGLGLDESDLDLLEQSASLHDVGNLALDTALLDKTGPVDGEDLEQIRRHTHLGQELLNGVTDNEWLAMAAVVAHTHHERFDGSGYPAGLKGEAIPLFGRITAIVDVFDVLLTDRPYRRAQTLEAAIAELQSHSGQHFDPHLVEVFTKEPAALQAIREGAA